MTGPTAHPSRYIVWSVDPLTLEIYADVIDASYRSGARARIHEMRPDVIIPSNVPPMKVDDYIANLQLGLGRRHITMQTEPTL